MGVSVAPALVACDNSVDPHRRESGDEWDVVPTVRCQEDEVSPGAQRAGDGRRGAFWLGQMLQDEAGDGEIEARVGANLRSDQPFEPAASLAFVFPGLPAGGWRN